MNLHLISLSTTVGAILMALILVAMNLTALTWTALADQAGGQQAQFHIIVKKSERKLYLYRQESGREALVKTYDIALGPNPIGTKHRQGDGATPEGQYYISHKNARSKFYLSLGVSYPNMTDAEAGLKAGLITKTQHEAITTAIKRRKKPPQNTALGGDIFIHGGGSGKLSGAARDWTLGCVALENADIKELFDLAPEKTPVSILP